MDAWLYLGMCYRNGNGVRQDFKKSVHWYRFAAKQNDGVAQYFLGMCYRDGEGVRKNKRLAKLCFQKAIDNGEGRAKKALLALQALE